MCTFYDKHTLRSCKLAFEENGLIFTHRDTQVGDLVCQFPQSDVLAVLSFPIKPGYGHVEVPQAVNFLTCPPRRHN